MSLYNLDINIPTSEYPELGSPLFPDKASDKNVGRQYRDDYKAYRLDCNNSIDRASGVIMDYSGLFGEANEKPEKDKLSLHLKLKTSDTGVSKTYKFMGMDIDEDFDAIIPIASGNVLVGSMFNRDEVKRRVESVMRSFPTYRVPNGDTLEVTVKDLVDKVDTDKIRKIVTSMKEGAIYSFQKDISGSDDFKGSFKNFIKNLDRDLKDGGSVSTSSVLPYTSIILNLVNSVEIKKKDIEGVSSEDDKYTEFLVRIFLGSLIIYWVDVSKLYSAINTELSALDLWSDFNRKVIGTKEFNNRIYGFVTLSDSVNGEIVSNAVSFSGVARNGGISDSNVLRDQASSEMSSFSEKMTDGYEFGDILTGFDLKGVVLSNIDTDDIDDVSTLTLDECQALSVLDSLRYIDEDATVSRSSYDMDDPEQRGLFVKSAIRSYRKNFDEFRPVNDFDVTDALAEVVDRGDIETNNAISQDTMASSQNNGLDINGDIVTDSEGSLNIKRDINDLKKSMRLVNKVLATINKSFSVV